MRLAAMLCPGSRGAMRCLCAWEPCLSVERGSNAVFVCLAAMPDRGAGEQCAVCVPDGYALTGEQGRNAVFVCLATML